MSQSPSKASSLAIGTTVSIGFPTGYPGMSETFTPVGEVTTAKFSGIKVPTVDVSNFATPAKRKMATLPDYGTFTFTVLQVPNDAGQAAMLAAAASTVPYDFQIQLPVDEEVYEYSSPPVTTGTMIAFSGIVTEAGGFDIDLTKASEISYTVEIDGVWTVTS
jgi:hypothetical protein